MPFSAEDVVRWISGIVVPPLAAALITWIFAHVALLNLFHISEGEATAWVVQVVTFAVAYVGSLFVHHQVVTGKWSGAAREARIAGLRAGRDRLP